eukprot:2440610-Pleurochrysis_carterae.AAC.2
MVNSNLSEVTFTICDIHPASAAKPGAVSRKHSTMRKLDSSEEVHNIGLDGEALMFDPLRFVGICTSGCWENRITLHSITTSRWDAEYRICR